MNTRSFIKSILVTAIAPSILLPIVKDSYKWVKPKSQGIWVPNPAYVKAPYEIAFIHDQFETSTLTTIPSFYDYVMEQCEGVVYKRQSHNSKMGNRNYIIEDYPYRLDENKKPVSPLIFKQQ